MNSHIIPQDQFVDISNISKSEISFKAHQDEQITSFLDQMKKKDKEMRASMKMYFRKFKKDVSEAIEKIMRQSMLRVDSLEQMIEKVNAHQKQVNKVSRNQKKQKGQDLLVEQELRQCNLSMNCDKQSQIQNNIKNSYLIIQSFSIQQAECVAEDIMKLISSIDFFINDSKKGKSRIPNKVEKKPFKKSRVDKINNIYQLPEVQDIKSSIVDYQSLEESLSKQISQSFDFHKEIQLSQQSFLPSLINKRPSKLRIDYTNFSNQVCIFNTNNDSQQCYFNQNLSQNSNYVIQLIYHHLSNDCRALFYCGLISEKNKDIYWIDDIFYSQWDYGNTNKIIKGKSLQSVDCCATGEHKYEIHININERLFRICSPDKKNCQELDDQNYFEANTEYYFVIQFWNIQDTVTVHKIFEVNKFPNIIDDWLFSSE